MLVALSLLLLAQAETPAISPHTHHIRENRRLGGRWGGASYAFFEFAPADGAGMPDVCSTTAPTGAKGEVLTFTRATTATCTKTASGGLATTGIANGDLVSVASGVARVEYDANGVKGLLVEEARTNYVIRSQELDNASWGTTVSGYSAPVVTANAAVAPDGTTTADRVEIPATTWGYSLLQQAGGAVPAATNSASVYIKGNGTSGQVCISLGSAANVNCLCSYTSDNWTRCTCENKATTATILYFGNYTASGVGPCNGVSFPAQDIFVWGMQVETGAYVTSYIPTTSAAVTRNADQDPTFSGVSLAGLASSGSSAISVTPAATGSMTGGLIIMGSAGRPLYTVTTTARIYDGTNEITTAHNFTAGTTKRYWTSWSGSTLTVANASDGNSNSGSFDGAMATTSLQIGASAGAIGLTASWIVTKACLDPSPTRCR